MGVVIWISGDHSIETTKNTSVVVFPQQTVCPENLGESKQFEVSSQNINNHGAEKLLSTWPKPASHMTSGFGLFFENTFSSFLEEKVGHNKQVHVFFSLHNGNLNLPRCALLSSI